MILDDIEAVKIDELEGDEKSLKFKYIQIEIADTQNPDKKRTIIRGNADCEYHADILDQEGTPLQTLGFRLSCPGGGRIERKAPISPGKAEEIFVYGYSVGFGRPDHQKTCDILNKYFKSQTPRPYIHWSNEGY